MEAATATSQSQPQTQPTSRDEQTRLNRRLKRRRHRQKKHEKKLKDRTRDEESTEQQAVMPVQEQKQEQGPPAEKNTKKAARKLERYKKQMRYHENMKKKRIASMQTVSKEERQKMEKEQMLEQQWKMERRRLEKQEMELEMREQENRLMKRRMLELRKIEKERLEQEMVKQKRLEQRRLVLERLEQQRLETERLEKERLEQEALEKEALEKERLEKERLEKERLEKERLEQERLEQERIACQKELEQQELAEQQLRWDREKMLVQQILSQHHQKMRKIYGPEVRATKTSDQEDVDFGTSDDRYPSDEEMHEVEETEQDTSGDEMHEDEEEEQVSPDEETQKHTVTREPQNSPSLPIDEVTGDSVDDSLVFLRPSTKETADEDEESHAWEDRGMDTHEQELEEAKQIARAIEEGKSAEVKASMKKSRRWHVNSTDISIVDERFDLFSVEFFDYFYDEEWLDKKFFKTVDFFQFYDNGARSDQVLALADLTLMDVQSSKPFHVPNRGSKRTIQVGHEDSTKYPFLFTFVSQDYLLLQVHRDVVFAPQAPPRDAPEKFVFFGIRYQRPPSPPSTCYDDISSQIDPLYEGYFDDLSDVDLV